MTAICIKRGSVYGMLSGAKSETHQTFAGGLDGSGVEGGKLFVFNRLG